MSAENVLGKILTITQPQSTYFTHVEVLPIHFKYIFV